MLPGCPETHASFVAEPGPQTFEEEQSVVRADVRDRRLTSEPTRMVLKRDGSFRVEGLHWSGFGEEFAHGSGRAYIRCRACRHRKLWRPQASVYLDELTQQGGAKVYLELRYVLSGPTPPGFGHRGGRLLE
jgi:DNA-directed RNA polymerase subunit RPC12/RpoP